MAVTPGTFFLFQQLYNDITQLHFSLPLMRLADETGFQGKQYRKLNVAEQISLKQATRQTCLARTCHVRRVRGVQKIKLIGIPLE